MMIRSKAKSEVVSRKSSLSENQGERVGGMNCHETVTVEETAVFADATKRSKLTKPNENTSPGINKPHFAISVQTDQQSEKTPGQETDLESNPDSSNLDSSWEETYRGMPSWLTSLIIHLTLILTLALLSVGNGGKTMIDLFASTSEAVEIEPLVEVEITLETEELDTTIDELVVDDSILDQPEEFLAMPEMTNVDFESSFEDSQSALEPLTAVASKGGAKFFGIDGEGSDFVYIVDGSGSMLDYGRWKRAVKELKKSINELKEDQRFTILVYHNGYYALNGEADLVYSNQEERDRAIRWLGRNRPQIGNPTFCAESVAKGLSMNPDAIFLLSDGEFYDRENVLYVLGRFKDERRSSNLNPIPVHTVALGSHVGRWTMKRIADENNGVFKLVE